MSRPIALPVTLTHAERFPFNLLITDASGAIIIFEDRAAWSSKDRTVEDTVSGINHGKEHAAEAAEMNAMQIAKLQQIVDALNASAKP